VRTTTAAIAALATGSGTVTSVAASVPAFLSVAGSPITTTGTLAITLSGTALPVLNGGTGVTTSTGSGNSVLSTSPTLVTPILGTPTSGTLTNATGLPLTTGVTGTLPVANGGTGTTTPAIVAGTNVTVSGTWPNQTVNASGDVAGPASATDNAIARFDATTGKLLQNSLVTVSDTGAITAPVVGSVIPFYYDNQAAFPSAASYHGALAHSHADGAMFFAHGGVWVRMLDNGGPLGTPSSGTATNITGLPLTTGVTGTLPVANGGTGTTTPAIVAGTNVTVSGTWPNQTINASGGGGSGTVTSVATDATLTGGPITTTGTLGLANTTVTAGTYTAANITIDAQGRITAAANGSGGGGGTVTSASVVSANGFAGTVATASTTPAITLSTTITGLLKGNGTAISAATAGTDYLTPGGALGTPSSGTATNITGLPLTTGVTGTLPVANGGTGVTTSTGTGAVVLSTSPTLVTPILGTPSSGTATNITGLPLTTGVTGTLPVANGGTGVTTSTGSGNNVLSTSPTLVTPILGTPTSGTLTNATGLPLTTGVTGTLPVANGGTGVTTSTGTGAVVLGTSPTLNNPTITNYTESVVAIGTVGASNTIALTNGTVQTATLTASTATTFTMPTATAGKSFILLLKQAAATGNGTATFTSVKWGTAGAPTITATAGKMDILSFVADGTNWYGSVTAGYTP